MNIRLHQQARTTPAIRREIRAFICDFPKCPNVIAPPFFFWKALTPILSSLLVIVPSILFPPNRGCIGTQPMHPGYGAEVGLLR